MKGTLFYNKPCARIEKYWTRCIGSCHAATALREDWRQQLRTCREAFGFSYVRFHGLLDDDMSVCLRQEDGSLVYSFFNVDSIFDFLLEIGMKPFIELSFMPEALASGSQTVFHYRGNITPPNSYAEWAELVGRLAGHLVNRYGAGEVRQWFFEVWNEPNLDMFWSGTMAEYFQLYESAARAIKEVDAQLAVGGPSTAIDAWIPELREYCSQRHVPLDFISTHHYPTDAAFGLGLDMEEQMARSKRGVLHERAEKARSESGSLPLFYTEWNSSPSPRDPYHDTPYCAAFIIKTIADNMGLVDAYSFWTFTDIFEEAGFSSVPFHGGFGLLNIHGIPKPSFRAFQLLERLRGNRLELAVDEASPTVDCIAARDQQAVTILLANHNVPRSPIQTEQVTLRLAGLQAVQSASLIRIDDAHANAQKAWVKMGSPTYLDNRQIDSLLQVSRLAEEPFRWYQDENGVTLQLSIEPHAVAAILLMAAP